MPGINDEAFGRIEGVATKSNKELASELGTHRETIDAVRRGSRGMAPELARSVAMKSGEKPATAFIRSQSAALQQKIRAEKITLMGVVDAAQMALQAVTAKFRPDEIDRQDPEFRQAVLELKTAATKALELLGDGDASMAGLANARDYPEEAHDLNSGVTAVAAKSTRDAHGKAVPEGEKVERDAHGRRIR